MIFRELTVDNDWTFGAGLANMTARNQAIGLNIKTRLQSWVGDCFFDTQAGVDWVNRLGSKNQRNLLDLELRRIILRSWGVTALVKFDTFLNGRSFSAEYSVLTVYGQEYRDSLNVEI